jgi:DNA-binding response OmpR family regulator
MAARILVVNDTPEILDIFRELLEGEGYEVVLYSFAIMDMQEVLRIEPDLVLLDYVFGSEKLGWQMLQKLRMTRETEGIPIVICTAATREVHDIEGYLQSQGIRVVPKPFNIGTLLDTVRLSLRSDPIHDALLKRFQEEPPREEGEDRGDELRIRRPRAKKDKEG